MDGVDVFVVKLLVEWDVVGDVVLFGFDLGLWGVWVYVEVVGV